MQKVAFIILVVIIGSSCAVRRASERISDSSQKVLEALPLLLASENITQNDFYIRKAEIRIQEGEEKQKLIANVKFKKQGVFLLSIRTVSGIEILRIFSDSDSVKINDRMNRRVYLGSAKAVLGKYGIDIKVLPVILGDFINGEINIGEIRNNNYVQGSGMIGSSRLDYTVDTRQSKVIRTRISDNYGKDEIIIDFSDFKKIGNLTYAHDVKLQSIENQLYVEIKFFGVELLEVDIQEFIPGRNYEIILLK